MRGARAAGNAGSTLRQNATIILLGRAAPRTRGPGSLTHEGMATGQVSECMTTRCAVTLHTKGQSVALLLRWSCHGLTWLPCSCSPLKASWSLCSRWSSHNKNQHKGAILLQ